MPSQLNSNSTFLDSPLRRCRRKVRPSARRFREALADREGDQISSLGETINQTKRMDSSMTRMQSVRIWLATVSLLVGLILSGCASNKSKYGSVYREWSSRMSEMGIFPVYPPREDIVVGDVYALPLHPYDRSTIGYLGGLGSAGIHVGYLGDTNMGWSNFSEKLLTNYYNLR